ncbi:hypothetical protein CORC01_04522 [Colletotrichum orchidophilum]|uniref:Uncharacterized protein n=1 Tax=Colletotrichum orchidophilum TaxID=1209926 RepID=A0A1G4BFF2_9PEZI|nr:uncharacterized protein CORC01_04522 [Colletotrichum orchidophilum]OHF00114.1 hypothetical protein CORC01_04522 [Colletotrichum orchidophilum]
MPESLHSRAVAKKSLLLWRRACRIHRTSSGRRCLFPQLRLLVLVTDQFINDLSTMLFVPSRSRSIYLDRAVSLFSSSYLYGKLAVACPGC